METLCITIVADSKPIGGLVRATYEEGRMVTRDTHFAPQYRTPFEVKEAIRGNPMGGRVYHAGTLYRWYSHPSVTPATFLQDRRIFGNFSRVLTTVS